MILDVQQVIRTKLQDDFMKLCNKNPQYTLRSFAQKLKTSSSSLSEIFNSKRNISKAKALDFAGALNWSNNEVQEIEELFLKHESFKSLINNQSNHLEEEVIQIEDYKFISDWKYFALLAALRLSDSSSTREWLYSKFDIAESEINECLSDLEQSGFITIDDNGLISECGRCFRTSEDFPEENYYARIAQGLEGAKKTMKSEDFIGTFSTVSVDPDKLKEAEHMIESFLKSLSIFLSKSTNKTKVMELNIHLFPRSR